MRYRNDLHTSRLKEAGVAQLIAQRLVALKDVKSVKEISELRLFVHFGERAPSFGEITAYWTPKDRGMPTGSRSFGWGESSAFGYGQPPLTQKQLEVVNELLHRT